MFASIGVIVRLFYGPISMIPVSKLIGDVLPITLIFSTLAAILVLIYLKVFNAILFFFAGIVGSTRAIHYFHEGASQYSYRLTVDGRDGY